MKDIEEVVNVVIKRVADLAASVITSVPKEFRNTVIDDFCHALNDAIEMAESEKVN